MDDEYDGDAFDVIGVFLGFDEEMISQLRQEVLGELDQSSEVCSTPS